MEAQGDEDKTPDQVQQSDEPGAQGLREDPPAFCSKFATLDEAERALVESHDRLLSIVETANDPIIGADSDGNIIMWNSAASRTFGYSAEEVMNRPVTLLMAERFSTLHEHAMQRAAAKGNLYYHKHVREVAGLRKDGTEFPVEVSLSAWRTHEGMFFTGIVRDITERRQKDEELRKANEELERRVAKRTAELVELNKSLQEEIRERNRVEERLRTSERIYHTLIEEVPDVIFILCEGGRFTFLNAQAEKFFQRPLYEVLDTQISSYVVPEERQKIESMFALGPDSIWDEEIRLVDGNGESKFARIRCKALGGEGNGESCYEGVMRDITRRRRLEEQLRESREQLLEKIRIIDELYAHIVESGKAKAIAEHTAEVAHELRQPLAIIGGFARRIARKIDSCDMTVKEGRARAVGFISSEIQRLEKILNTLIDFTRKESLSQEMMNPNTIIEKTVALYEEVLEDRGINLEVKLGEDVGEILLDSERFEQVVRNLISNAVEASPRGQTIHVETGISMPGGRALETAALEPASYFEMKIRNRGIAVKQEDLAKLFSPFFTTKDYGTGIGLTVCKKIIEAHNGSISVHSDDKGTTFIVWLPLIEQETSMRSPHVSQG